MLRKMLIAKLAAALVIGLASMQWVAAQSSAEDTPDISRLQNALGGAKPDSISEMAVPGLYEVVLGSQILYLTKDGRFVIQGEVIDLDSADNLTENRRTKLRLSAIDAVGENNMIIFDAKDGKVKHTITVFTDVDCGYCRKLHREIASYNDLGIRVRYLMFPRAGLKSQSYDTAVSVWCADDQQTAMTQAKLGQKIAEKSCANPVASHYNLGQQLGVRGTPSIILDNGEMVPGYVPAARLAQMFN